MSFRCSSGWRPASLRTHNAGSPAAGLNPVRVDLGLEVRRAGPCRTAVQPGLLTDAHQLLVVVVVGEVHSRRRELLRHGRQFLPGTSPGRPRRSTSPGIDPTAVWRHFQRRWRSISPSRFSRNSGHPQCVATTASPASWTALAMSLASIGPMAGELHRRVPDGLDLLEAGGEVGQGLAEVADRVQLRPQHALGHVSHLPVPVRDGPAVLASSIR